MSQDKLIKLYKAIKHKLNDYELSILESLINTDKKFDPISGSPDYPSYHATNNSGNNVNIMEEDPYYSYYGDNTVNVYRGLNNFTNSFEQQT